MTSLMILSHTLSNSHFHAAQIVPMAVVAALIVGTVLFFGRRALVRK